MVGRLSVDRRMLAEALRTLERIAGRSKSRAVDLHFAKGLLTLDSEGQSASVAASGEWTGHCRLQLLQLLRIRTHLPEQDPLELVLTEESLAIGSVRLTAPPAPDPEAEAERHLLQQVHAAALILAPFKVNEADLLRLVGEKAQRGKRGRFRAVRAGEGDASGPWGKRPRHAAALLSDWAITEGEIAAVIRSALRRWAT